MKFITLLLLIISIFAVVTSRRHNRRHKKHGGRDCTRENNKKDCHRGTGCEWTRHERCESTDDE